MCDNGYQKVLKAINGISMETPPMSLILSLYGSRITSCSSEKYYTDATSYFKGQQAIIERYNPDIVFTPFALSFEGEAYGSELKYLGKMPPQLKKPVIESFDQIRNLRHPSFNSGTKAYVLEATSLLAQQYKKEKFIAGFSLSCIDVCTMIMGIEGFLDTLLFHSNETKSLFEITSRHFIEYGNALFETGIDALVIPSSFCSPTIVTNRMIEEVILGPLTNALRQIRGPVILHHGSAVNLKFLHYFVDLPNIVGFVIDDRESLGEARKIAGEKLILGNLGISLLAHKKPGTIRQKCFDILRERRNDHRFILLNAGPDVKYDTPHINIMAVCNAVKDFANHES
jgi:uroporphyrinogen decarboxylase